MKNFCHWVGYGLVTTSLIFSGCKGARNVPIRSGDANTGNVSADEVHAIHATLNPPSASSSNGKENSNEGMHARFALLIGCTVYPNLSEDLWLMGPSADVAITKDLLLSERYNYDESKIVTLVYENPPEGQPTYENIVKSFERLISEVVPGDQVFILLAGHGGQQPNTNSSDDPEPDGLDELFVPQDVTGWNRNDKLENRHVILDDQIGQWLGELRDSGVFVFFVADSCHSGSLNRGVEEPDGLVRNRSLPPIFSPSDAPYTSLAENSDSKSALDIPTDIVTIFAVPAHFAAREQPMPPAGSTGTSGIHGRLSYALNEVLRSTRRPLSYRELMQQLRWKHVAWNWSPFPYGEGSHLDRMVFGIESFPERSLITSVAANRQFELNVGSLNQIQPGCIFAVYPPAGALNDDKVSGYVQVTSARAAKSFAQPCEYGSAPATALEQFPRFGRCELVYRELGDARVAVMVISDPDDPPSSSTIEQVNQSLREICRDPHSLTRVASSAQECEIIAVVSDEHILLRRKYDAVVAAPSDSGGAAKSWQAILPFAIEDDLSAQLASRLLMISRAINLMRLAESEAFVNDMSRRKSNPIELQITVKLRERDSSEFRVVEDPTELELYDGDILRFVISNRGSLNVDVTALVVESGFAIKAFALKELDSSGNARYLDAYQSRIVAGDDSKFFELKVNDDTIGVENLVLIAVPGIEAVHANFDYLEQPGLESVLSHGLSGTRGNANTPFHMLLENTFYQSPPTRGPRVTDAEAVIRRISWKVVKAQ